MQRLVSSGRGVVCAFDDLRRLTNVALSGGLAIGLAWYPRSAWPCRGSFIRRYRRRAPCS